MQDSDSDSDSNKFIFIIIANIHDYVHKVME